MKKPYLLILVSTATLPLHSPRLMAASQEAPVLEEIVVTAQKRPQHLRDVPLSVTAVSGATLEASAITATERLADQTPNFNMTQTGIGTNIAIRGVSSGVNQGFEQSAALYVDGIHFGRAQLARAPLLDLQRVEVLRGPQSILFGKNATAGAIHLITAKPANTPQAHFSYLLEPEQGEQDARIMLTGLLGQHLYGRLALLNRNMDGYLENTTFNRKEPGENTQVARASLQWLPNDWDILLKLEKGAFNAVGRNTETIKPIEKANAQGEITPYAQALYDLTGNTYRLDTQQNRQRQSNGDSSNNTTENITLTLEHPLQTNSLALVSGYNAYKYDELCDCDFTGAPGFSIFSHEAYRQFSQEIRLSSPDTLPLSYITGLFFQNNSIRFHDATQVPTDSFIVTALTIKKVLGAPAAGLLRGSSYQRTFSQDTQNAAAFGQATWRIHPSTKLHLGVRYTTEEKSAQRHLYIVSNTGQTLPQGTAADLYNQIWSPFKVDPHQLAGKRSEGAFTPLATLQYQLNNTDTLYASYTTGFKSGGFDVRSNAAPNALGGVFPAIDGTWEFDEERVKNLELGGKFLLANGAAEVNAALFRSEFSNLQTSQFDGSLSFKVTNAGEALVQGLEVDGRFAIQQHTNLRGGAGYLDFTFTRFPNAQCYFGQTDNIAPLGDGICDATGLAREFTPKIQGHLGLDHSHLFHNGYQLTASLEAIYSHHYLTTPSLDPNLQQPAYTKWNARLALSKAQAPWEIALVGKNLTDQAIITYANGLPVATTVTKGTGSGYYAFYERPRSLALQASLKF